MSITWRAALAGLEAASVVCAALNLAYFIHRAFASRSEPLSRRIAAFVLALVSLGALMESVFVLGAAVLGNESPFGTAAWMAVRVLTFAGTACISALVLRAVGK